MDPALWEMLDGDADDEVEAIIRLKSAGAFPEGVRLVARFGRIATCRLRRGAIREVWSDESVASLKAPRGLVYDPPSDIQQSAPSEDLGDWETPLRRPPVAETGRGVVLGVIDWGCDIAHPNFLDEQGETRLLALWDQRRRTPVTAENRYGRGTIHSRDAINRALASDCPYAALDYHPADSEVGRGAHGTHVMDIACGNGHVGQPGLAPEADPVFVHLSSSGTGGLANFGDSVAVLEAVDFILEKAGNRPCVINMSMGRHGGPHDGSTLVEQGLDEALAAAPGRAIVNSTGNYFARQVHAAGQLRPGETRTLVWNVDRADQTPNELEIWYSPRDKILFRLRSPDGEWCGPVPLGKHQEAVVGGEKVGRMYHRALDPNNQQHHVDIFLDPGGPTGRWEVVLIGEEVVDGRFHAWIERDVGARHNQSRFEAEDADPSCTTGTIANGFSTIAVGAYDPSHPDRPLARFSSAGPTRDGRQKPDLVAPGVRIEAACSAPYGGRDADLLTRKSGTSMAAPHVSGTIALMFEAAARPLSIHQTRSILLPAADEVSGNGELRLRVGSGYLNSQRAVAAAREVAGAESHDEGVDTAPASESPLEHEDLEVESMEETPSAGDEAMAPALDDGTVGEESPDDADLEPPDHLLEADEEEEEDLTAEKEEGDEELIAEEEEGLSPEEPESWPTTWPGQAKVPFAQASFRAASLFDSIMAGDDLSSVPGDGFELIAYPKEHVEQELRPGDLLIRRALGEGNLASESRLVTGELLSLEEAVAEGLSVETDIPGFYAHVVESAPFERPIQDQFARRITEQTGRLLHDQLLIRPSQGDNGNETRLVAEEAAERFKSSSKKDLVDRLKQSDFPKLTRGDRDRKDYITGRYRRDAIYTGQISALRESRYVTDMQEALSVVGIKIVGEPDGSFGPSSELAVRELQIYAGMKKIARDPDNPAERDYAYSLVQESNVSPYSGKITGTFDANTRKILAHWLNNSFRCPVVIQACTINKELKKDRVSSYYQNIWRHNELYDRKLWVFVRDLSGHYDENTEFKLLTAPDGQKPTKLMYLGRRYGQGPCSGGVKNKGKPFSWPSSELLPENMFGKTYDSLLQASEGSRGSAQAEEALRQLSTYKVVRYNAEKECEGRLDVVNGWDPSFISIGPYHSTLGHPDGDNVNPGELCGFFCYFKERYDLAFEQLFGKFGFDTFCTNSIYQHTTRQCLKQQWAILGDQCFFEKQRKYCGWICRWYEKPDLTGEVEHRPVPNKKNDMNYYRSWHWFYRFVMAGRVSGEYRRAWWDMARLKIRDIGNTPVRMSWLKGLNDNRVPLVKDVFTSETAIAILVTLHASQPDNIVEKTSSGRYLNGVLSDIKTFLSKKKLKDWGDEEEKFLIDHLIKGPKNKRLSSYDRGHKKAVFMKMGYNYEFNGKKERGLLIGIPSKTPNKDSRKIIIKLDQSRHSFKFDDSGLPRFGAPDSSICLYKVPAGTKPWGQKEEESYCLEET
jgi:subtilisin family serine protease